jgi:hypothetical protein
MSQQQQALQPRQPVQNRHPLNDWQVNIKNRSVHHRSGLVIQLNNKNAAQHKLAAFEILSIEKLTGTPWAARSNLLIETGIALLAAL